MTTTNSKKLSPNQAIDQHTVCRATNIHRLAIALHPNSETHRAVEERIIDLTDICVHGLPNCYANFNEFLTDFHFDFPYTGEERTKQLHLLATDPRIDGISKIINENWGFDLATSLRKDLGLTPAN
jgi:hypothetical protein